MREVTPTEVARFVAEEARTLNERRYRDWLALFTSDGRYWVPLQAEAQPESPLHASLADEDPVLLAIRIERLANPRAHSMHGGVRSLHTLGPSHVGPIEGGEIAVSTPFQYLEVKGDRQVLLGGVWRHRLRVGESLKIARKRVDLLNAGSPHEAIHLFP
jgi:3-phenylpropionate/cinnamic acid dioxygenase small subunit